MTLIQALIEVSENILVQLALVHAGKASADETDFEHLDLDRVQSFMDLRGQLLEKLNLMGSQGQLTAADEQLTEKILHLGMLDGEVEIALTLMRQSIQARLSTIGQNKTVLGHYAATLPKAPQVSPEFSAHNNLA